MLTREQCEARILELLQRSWRLGPLLPSLEEIEVMDLDSEEAADAMLACAEMQKIQAEIHETLAQMTTRRN